MNIHSEIERLIINMEKVIIGKRDMIKRVITVLLCNGHVLIEDVPGVGKTQLVAALSRSVEGKFNRIQMTPDIMPSDIIGFTMIHPETKKFIFKRGAAFCNFLLADEVNRASPKAQSSLLEVMEEHQVSYDGQTFALPQPFMTLATQNPVETIGTQHLPEAQMDRFLMRLSMGYPSKEDELSLLDNVEGDPPLAKLAPVLHVDDIIRLQDEVKRLPVHPLVKEYIWALVNATRTDENIKLGVSPRGSIALQKAAKAMAFINSRTFVTPDDVKEVAISVLAHRVILSAKGKSVFRTQEAVIRHILGNTAVPVPTA
ncbi:AAA family ATPase [Gorillibacterium sp. sgz5001074]|uniref:AAA family ATPase n=1 Tax=Gorillibacterium sp. sgz5001074 TaxID=3446695 RepID=UPI003F67E266